MNEIPEDNCQGLVVSTTDAYIASVSVADSQSDYSHEFETNDEQGESRSSRVRKKTSFEDCFIEDRSKGITKEISKYSKSGPKPKRSRDGMNNHRSNSNSNAHQGQQQRRKDREVIGIISFCVFYSYLC